MVNLQRRTARRGFTLIELLVVIAIIALLAAIIFPVFATVRENARQSSSISNMRQISTALAQFQLDNHKNPDVLFGYAYYMYSAGGQGALANMDTAFAAAQSDAQNPVNGVDVNATFPGLYPEYVRDVSTFRDADNPDNGNNPSVVKTVKVNVLQNDGTLTAVNKTFYDEDAYDISPQVTGDRTLSNGYVPRYQTSWTNIDDPMSAAGVKLNCSPTSNQSLCGANGVNFYTHQLRWKAPPAETYVTSTTYHVPNAGTVLVLFEGGSTKKMSFAQFTAYGNGTDATDISVAANGISAANYWKLMPSGR